MRNVVLIVLDTVRKDYFDEHALRLQRLADTEFDWCYAPSSWSIPSHASMLSGVLPHRHGVHSYNPDYADIDETFLHPLDHRSLAVSANGAVSDTFGFGSHFDEFAWFAGNDEYSPDALSFKHVEDVEGLRRYAVYLWEAVGRGVFAESLLNGLYRKTNDILDGTLLPNFGDGGAVAVADKSLSMIDGAEPFVLFLNFIDAHGPMRNRFGLDSDVPYDWSSQQLDVETVRTTDREHLADYLKNYRELYAANVRYLDRRVSALVDRINEHTERETTFVITADHGEELRYPGERDLGHNDFSTPLLHVPLITIGADAPDVTETGLTSLLDVGTVVKHLARGESLPDITRNRVPAERIGMLFHDGDDDYWTRGVRTVYEGDIRYEWDMLGRTSRIAVDVSVDGERTPAEPPAVAREEFATPLDEYVAAARETSVAPDVDQETRQHLANLGYRI